MKNGHRVLNSLTALLLSLALGTASAASGWTDSALITEINQQPAAGAGATLVFVDTTATVNPSGCSPAKGFYFAVNDERKKRLFATLVAAQMASRNVKIYTTGNCHSPWGHAELDGLIVN